MARNYAAIPYEYKRKMAALSDAEFGRLCRALIDYSADGTPIALNGNERFYAEMVMMDDDRYRDAYEASITQKREAGKASAARRALNGVQRRSTEANGTNEIKTKININTPAPIGARSEAATPPPRASARFSPPSVEDVAAYCTERGNLVDAQQFVDFYASKGWKVGNQPMKDWKAAVRTWEKRDRDRATGADVAHNARDWRFEDL